MDDRLLQRIDNEMPLSFLPLNSVGDEKYDERTLSL